MTDNRIPAIRVACDEESGEKYSTKQYETYQLFSDHEIFRKGEISPVSTLVGVPVLLLKLRPSLLRPRGVRKESKAREKLAFGSRIEGDYFDNSTARALMATCKGVSREELMAPPDGWREKVGSVLIARVDRKPLRKAHLCMMLSFLEEVLLQGMQSEEELKVLLTPECFQSYYLFAKKHLTQDFEDAELLPAPAPFEATTQVPMEKIESMGEYAELISAPALFEANTQVPMEGIETFGEEGSLI